MKRKNLKKIMIIALSAVILYILVFPIPIWMNRSLPAIRGRVGDQYMNASACTVEIEGTYYFYLLRPDQFIGTLSISGEAVTQAKGAQLQTTLGDAINPLIYLTDDGYVMPGTICASGLLSEMLIGLSDDNSVFSEGSVFVCAPASSVDEARGVVARLCNRDEYLSSIDW